MKIISALLLISIGLIAGEQMYTQVGMWAKEEKSGLYKGSVYYTSIDKSYKNKKKISGRGLSANFTILGTNFSRGLFIPVNSQVEVLANTSNRMFFKIEDKVITIYNKDNYTKLDNTEFLHRQFGVNKVDLSEFDEEDKKNIHQGRVKVGMSKKAVLLTRGYPPAHKTPSLKSDRWQYWEENTHSHYYYFKDGWFDGKD